MMPREGQTIILMPEKWLPCMKNKETYHARICKTNERISLTSVLAKRVICDSESACDDACGSADESADVGMPEAHEAQAGHGCDQGDHVDDGAHGIAEDWRVAVGVLDLVHVRAPSVEHLVEIGVG